MVLLTRTKPQYLLIVTLLLPTTKRPESESASDGRKSSRGVNVMRRRRKSGKNVIAMSERRRLARKTRRNVRDSRRCVKNLINLRRRSSKHEKSRKIGRGADSARSTLRLIATKWFRRIKRGAGKKVRRRVRRKTKRSPLWKMLLMRVVTVVGRLLPRDVRRERLSFKKSQTITIVLNASVTTRLPSQTSYTSRSSLGHSKSS